MIQHDSSHHQFSKYANKWYLITSLDDYSRLILYAVLVERETTWVNIIALKVVILGYGIPYSYYVDSYSVYRFVQGRDSNWRNHYKLTDEVEPQWKQVLNDCGVKVKYALSPQAKGKIERPYRWIQDRLVRACYRERISDIKKAQLVLNSLIQKYNHQWIHSRIQLRIVPDKESGLSEVRFWHEDELLGIQKVKNSELNLVHF
jgi:hypothetical protein